MSAANNKVQIVYVQTALDKFVPLTVELVHKLTQIT